MNRVLMIHTERTQKLASWMSRNTPRSQHRTGRPDGRVTISIIFHDDEDAVLFMMAHEGRFNVIGTGHWEDKVDETAPAFWKASRAVSNMIAAMCAASSNLPDDPEPPQPKGRSVAPNSSIKSARQARACR